MEKTLRLGKIEGRRRREQQRMKWLDGITDLMDMSLSKLQVLLMGRKLPGSCPGGSRVIQRGDGVGEEKLTYLEI